MSTLDKFMSGVHNELSPEEKALKQRLIAQGKVRRAILAELSKLNVQCTKHKWACFGPKPAWHLLNPKCLICGTEDEFKWYCYDSPSRECEYHVGDAIIQGSMDLTDSDHPGLCCIHCGHIWERSS